RGPLAAGARIQQLLAGGGQSTARSGKFPCAQEHSARRRRTCGLSSFRRNFEMLRSSRVSKRPSAKPDAARARPCVRKVAQRPAVSRSFKRGAVLSKARVSSFRSRKDCGDDAQLDEPAVYFQELGLRG